MTNSTFLYLTFGENLNIHAQVIFSILTMKKFAPSESKFVIYTDQPKFYKWLKNTVEIRHTPREQLDLWEGPYKFFWRVKIMAMLDSANKDPGHLIYVDSDTFSFSSLKSMYDLLDAGTSFMHLPESKISLDEAENKKLLWKVTENKTIAGFLIDKNSTMWNAGVVAIPSSKKLNSLTQALKCNDELCATEAPRWLVEQFSLSLALFNNGPLERASSWIGHYWGNKDEWNHNIHYFFSKLLQADVAPNETGELIEIEFWKKIPINRMERSMHKNLKKFADSYWPDKVKDLND